MTSCCKPILTPRDIVATYIRAKDENRPHLMRGAFATTAELRVVATPGTISFPGFTQGIDPITDILVRRFAQTYENVHTFCLAAAPRDDATTFSCPWLVGMSEKETRAIRVGCGRYDWVFNVAPPRLVGRLTITIELMQSLAADTLPPIMDWLAQLPYPWCSAQTAVRTAPTLDDLRPVLRYITAD